MENCEERPQQQQQQQNKSISIRNHLLVLNCILLTIGNCGGPLISRLYFLQGGSRIWLSSWLQTVGFPIILIPLIIGYYQRRRRAAALGSTNKAKVFFITPWLTFVSILVGVGTGFENYLYAYGVAWLPVTTSNLIIASQLVFTAFFAFLFVKQKFTPYSINAIVLLTLGGSVLAMNTGDRPTGESNQKYITGFLMTVAASLLYGIILPVVELTYQRTKQQLTYTLVMEMQLVLSISATVVCTVGMLINKDFQVISREAAEFGLGPTKYYSILVASAIIWQGYFLGAIGVIFSSSSLFSAIVIAVMLPVIELLALIFFKESFQVEKGLSLALNLWGFISYFYGDYKNSKKLRQESQPQLEIV